MTALTNSFIAARQAFERNTREIEKGINSLDVAMSLLQTKSADAPGIHEAALHHLTEARGMREACKGAMIDPPVEFRQLRTSYGSLLLNADAPLSTISELLGHKDPRMTRRHYAHLLSEKLKETVDEKLTSFRQV